MIPSIKAFKHFEIERANQIQALMGNLESAYKIEIILPDSLIKEEPSLLPALTDAIYKSQILYSAQVSSYIIEKRTTRERVPQYVYDNKYRNLHNVYGERFDGYSDEDVTREYCKYTPLINATFQERKKWYDEAVSIENAAKAKEEAEAKKREEELAKEARRERMRSEFAGTIKAIQKNKEENQHLLLQFEKQKMEYTQEFGVEGVQDMDIAPNVQNGPTRKRAYSK